MAELDLAGGGGAVQGKWKEEELGAVPKKELVEWLQANGSEAFLQRHGLRGKSVNVAKTQNKGSLDAAYRDLLATRHFRSPSEGVHGQAAPSSSSSSSSSSSAKPKPKPGPAAGGNPAPAPSSGPKGYKKHTIKKGDKTNFPQRGDNVSVR
jgi:FK506-binding protein 3